MPAAVAVVLLVTVVAGSGLEGGGEVDRGGGQGEEVADDGGDVGPGVHRYGSDQWWVVRGGRSVLTSPSLWSPAGVWVCVAVSPLLVTTGGAGPAAR